jgi:riboflavin kinase/FMN adenylyltransferase
MRTVTDPALLRKEKKPVVLAAGFFDGLHRGHRKVIERPVRSARARGGRAWVLTFDVHPMEVLEPRSAPDLLTSTQHKLRLLAEFRLDGCLVMPFTRELADMAPELFVERLCDYVPSLAEVLVGRNWRFGHDGRGNTGLLARLAGKRNIRVTGVLPAVRKGKVISSTRIRTEIVRGNLAEAAVMLGRPFSVLGTVTRGRTMGRRLGFPTANLDPHNEVLPPRGVYAVHAELDGKHFDGVLNLGTRPTFMKRQGKNEPVLEVHLFDVRRNLYGKEIEVFIARKLRNERRFSSALALKRQIACDVEDARKVVGALRVKTG